MVAHWLRAGVTGVLAPEVHTGHAKVVVVLCVTAFGPTSAVLFWWALAACFALDALSCGYW